MLYQASKEKKEQSDKEIKTKWNSENVKITGDTGNTGGTLNMQQKNERIFYV